jgi:hypothetical protein
LSVTNVGFVETERSFGGALYITKKLGREDQVFVDNSAMAFNAAISGSILADPDACLVMVMALPLGSTRALLTAHAISR